MLRWFLLATFIAVAVPVVEAAWDDPALGGSGDYAWIDLPPLGTPLIGPTTFNGTAGNNYTIPNSGSEASPQSRDPPGDTTCLILCYPPAPGSDIGNSWVTVDTGTQFKVNLRLYDGPIESTPTAATVYVVHFRHVPTGVTYRLDAQYDAGALWRATLYARTSDPTQYCGLPRTVEASHTGYAPAVLTWQLDYTDLDVAATPPPFTSVPCLLGVTYAAPAAVGQDLCSWEGSSTHKGSAATASVSWAIVADPFSTPVSCWRLGPFYDPAGPFSPVLFFLNTYPMGSTSTMLLPTDPEDFWTTTFDPTIIPPVDCKYTIMVMYGTASDTREYPAAGCLPPEPPPPPAIQGEREELPEVRPTIGGKAPPPIYSPDHDLDGIYDGLDGCTFNRGSNDDIDGDGLGEACDDDIDGDGIHNHADNCPYDVNRDQRDVDGNGIGDACEPDLDGDGIPDDSDNCPDVVNVFQADLDGDGIGDACDDDIDGDGASNRPGAVPQDVFPRDPTEWGDLDGDGIGDNSDPDIDGDGFLNHIEVAAGTDPWDPQSYPREVLPARPAGLASPAALTGWFGWLGLVGLLVVGVALFLLLRPRQAAD